MTEDEILRIHTDMFYGALKSQNYGALEELYSDDYMLVRLVATSCSLSQASKERSAGG